MHKDIFTTHEIVLAVLKAQPMARNSDNHLCYWVYKNIARKNGFDIDNMSMPSFLFHMKEYGFPSIETVTRTRRKIQADHPELCASAFIENERSNNEASFRKYARGF